MWSPTARASPASSYVSSPPRHRTGVRRGRCSTGSRGRRCRSWPTSTPASSRAISVHAARCAGCSRSVSSRRTPSKQHSPHHRSEEHTSELQSPYELVCRHLLEKTKKNIRAYGKEKKKKGEKKDGEQEVEM